MPLNEEEEEVTLERQVLSEQVAVKSVLATPIPTSLQSLEAIALLLVVSGEMEGRKTMDCEIVVLLIQGNFALCADVLTLDAVFVIKPSANPMELHFTYTTSMASIERERVVLANRFFITSGHNLME